MRDHPKMTLEDVIDYYRYRTHVPKQHKWTSEEIENIKQHFPSERYECLKRLPKDISRTSLAHKIRRLGL